MIWAAILVFTLFFVIPPTAFAVNIKINEFYAAGSTSSNPDWVEVYNEGLDISLYQLIDAKNNKKDLGGANCSGNFCTIDWYNTLNNGGDTIKLVLKTSPDSGIDQVTYPGDISIPVNGQFAGRNPDGTGGWVIFSIPTKGTTNNSGTSTSSPTPAPTPTPSPTPTSLTTSSTSSPSTSSFSISSSPSQINSDQSFSITINLSLPDNPNSPFYLKGAFKKANGSNYFGLTKISDSWVKNGSSYSSQYPITTNSSGNWSGNLEIQSDSDDSGFTGTGDYIFKVGRYTNSGSGPTWSNESNIKIISTEIEEQGNTSTLDTPSSTANPSSSPKLVSKKSASLSQASRKINYNVASIAGVTIIATPSATPASITVKTQKQTNPVVWIGLILVFAGASSLGYIYWKKR